MEVVSEEKLLSIICAWLTCVVRFLSDLDGNHNKSGWKNETVAS
jgi:hypothetical protein